MPLLGIDDQRAAVTQPRVAVLVGIHLAVVLTEDDALNIAGHASSTVGSHDEVRTEGLDDGTGSVLVETATISSQHIACAGSLQRGIAIVRQELVAGGLDRRQFVVADRNGDARLGSEDDFLLTESRDFFMRVLGIERATEVELIVAVARQTDDIGRSCRTVRIAAVDVLILVVRLLVLILVHIPITVITVIVIPEEGIGIVLLRRTGIGLRHVGDEGMSVSRRDRTALELTQPVLMTRSAAIVEVGDLTLVGRRHQLGAERQADSLPALLLVDKVIGSALVPHAVITAEGVLDRTVEVVTVDEHMVERGIQFAAAAIDQMTVDASDVISRQRIDSAVFSLHARRRISLLLDHLRLCEVRRQDCSVIRDGISRNSLGRSGHWRVHQQVPRLVGISHAGEADRSVEDRTVEDAVGIEGLAVALVVIAREVDGRHARVGLVLSVGRLGGHDGIRVEVEGSQLLVAEIGRCTEDAVRLRNRLQRMAVARLVQMRRHLLMSTDTSVLVAIGERLSEEEIVVGPQRLVSEAAVVVGLQTDIIRFRNHTVGIEEVDVIVRVAVLHIAVGVDLVGSGSLTVVTLLQEEAVQVVGHLAVVELLFRHATCDAVTAVGGLVVACGGGIVTVLYLSRRADLVTRIAEDGIDIGIGGGAGLHPAVLHIAVARIGDTGRGERAAGTKVVDMAAEVAEERLVESADGIALTMERTGEAVRLIAKRCPVGICLRRLVGMEEEVEVVACLHPVVERCVAAETADAEVEEVAQQVDAALGVASIVVQVDLTVTLHVGMVDMQMELRVGHHLPQVVVVGHAERYGIGIGLTEVGLGVVGQILTVLIPVDRCLVGELPAIAVALGVLLVLEDLPAAAHDLIGTRLHGGLEESHIVARQDSSRRAEVANLGHTTLEVDMDIDDMALRDRLDMRTALVALGIVVTEDDGDDTVLLQVEDIRLSGDIERGQFLRSITLDGEMLLEVRQLLVVVLTDEHTGTYVTTLADGRAGTDICHGMAVHVVADAVVRTTVIIGVVQLAVAEREGGHMTLLVVGQITVSLGRDDLSDGVRLVATGKGHIDHIDRIAIDLHRRVMVLLVGDGLVLLTVDDIAVAHSMRDTIVVGIVQCLGMRVHRLIVDRLYRRVAERCLVIVVEFHVAGVVRVDEQVEGVIVEAEVLTVLGRERRPCLQGRILLSGLEESAAIVTLLVTDVSRADHLVHLSDGCFPRPAEVAHIHIHNLVVTLRRQDFSKEHRLAGVLPVELNGTGADTGLLHLRRDGRPGSGRVVLLAQRRAGDEVIGLVAVGEGHVLLGDPGLSHLCLFPVSRIGRLMAAHALIVVASGLVDDLTCLIEALAVDTRRDG